MKPITHSVPHPTYYHGMKDSGALQQVLRMAEGAKRHLAEYKHASMFKFADALALKLDNPELLGRHPDFDVSDFETTRNKMRFAVREWTVSDLFKSRGGAVVESTAELDELMAQTDIDDIPSAMVKPPFPACYFVFNQPILTEGFEDRIIGAYLFYRAIEIDRQDPEDIDFVFNTSDEDINTVSKMDHYELALVTRANASPDPIASLRTTFALSVDSQCGVVENIKRLISISGLRVRGEGWEESASKAFTAVFKTMLYMGLKEARIKPHNELTEFNKKLANLGAKKLAKLSGKAGLKYDRIIVGPEHAHQEQNSQHSDTHKTTHWRRGHFRNQRFGEGFKDSRLTWIQPVIVNQVDDETPEKKHYKLKM